MNVFYIFCFMRYLDCCENQGNDKVSHLLLRYFLIFVRLGKSNRFKFKPAFLQCRVFLLHTDRIVRRRANRFIRYTRRTTLKGGRVARASSDSFSQAERLHDLSISERRGPRRDRKLIGSPVSALLWQMRIVRDVFSGRKWFDGGCLS